MSLRIKGKVSARPCKIPFYWGRKGLVFAFVLWSFSSAVRGEDMAGLAGLGASIAGNPGFLRAASEAARYDQAAKGEKAKGEQAKQDAEKLRSEAGQNGGQDYSTKMAEAGETDRKAEKHFREQKRLERLRDQQMAQALAHQRTEQSNLGAQIARQGADSGASGKPSSTGSGSSASNPTVKPDASAYANAASAVLNPLGSMANPAGASTAAGVASLGSEVASKFGTAPTFIDATGSGKQFMVNPYYGNGTYHQVANAINSGQLPVTSPMAQQALGNLSLNTGISNGNPLSRVANYQPFQGTVTGPNGQVSHIFGNAKELGQSWTWNNTGNPSGGSQIQWHFGNTPPGSPLSPPTQPPSNLFLQPRPEPSRLALEPGLLFGEGQGRSFRSSTSRRNAARSTAHPTTDQVINLRELRLLRDGSITVR